MASFYTGNPDKIQELLDRKTHSAPRNRSLLKHAAATLLACYWLVSVSRPQQPQDFIGFEPIKMQKQLAVTQTGKVG